MKDYKNKKLQLNKSTIAKLSENELSGLKGGMPNTYTCVVPSIEGECLKCPWPAP